MSSPDHMQPLSEPRARGIFQGRVESNRPLCPEHYLLRFSLDTFPPSRPGQFINIRCGSGESSLPAAVEWSEGRMPHITQPETAGRVPLLRRPFSLAGRRDAPDGSVELDILYRAIGAGTVWLAALESGAEIDLLGPLGNGFDIRENKSPAVVIGGGTGIGPMIYLAESLSAAGRSVTAFAGARTASALPLIEEQKGAFMITTDDGSLGYTGMVHEAFAQWLEREKAALVFDGRHGLTRSGRPCSLRSDTRKNKHDKPLVVYSCGPEPMMKAVADICTPAGIECQLAMERHMACGMGLCQGCAIKVKTDSPPGWMFKLVCKDGPVFEANELVWK